MTHAAPRITDSDSLLKPDRCPVVDVSRGDAAEHARGHPAQRRRQPNYIPERAADVLQHDGRGGDLHDREPRRRSRA